MAHTPIECLHFCYRLDSSLIILEPRLVKKRGHEDKCLLTLGRPHWHLCGYVHMSNCFRRHFSKSILTIPPRQKLLLYASVMTLLTRSSTAAVAANPSSKASSLLFTSDSRIDFLHKENCHWRVSNYWFWILTTFLWFCISNNTMLLQE